MIGIDIAANTSFANNFLNRPERFMRKILTTMERSTVLNSASPEKTALLIWTMKESAWKAHFPQSQSRKFNPKSYECQVHPALGSALHARGFVAVDGLVYSTLSELDSVSTHTIAGMNLQQAQVSIFNLNSNLPEAQSSAVRERMALKLAALFQVKPDSIEIKKNNFGLPIACLQGKQLPVHVSISHHNLLGAFVIAYEYNRNS
jgi:phosphopantetheinyl transferase (holo-ACP synthase)